MKIPAATLIADFQRMWREHWAYSWSAAEQGKVSCSGAFTWAYRQHGKSIYQGSNRIARRYIKELIPYSEAKNKGIIVPGMAAFKVRNPGDKWYALPEDYKKGHKYYDGDLGDYYHIGLVDEDVRYVLNAQSAKTGFVQSKITENWSHVALLTDVEYEETHETEGETMTSTVVGGRLALRSEPATTGKIICWMPAGSEVTVLQSDNDWSNVRYSGKTGYAMTKFLTSDPDNGQTAVADDAVTVTLTLNYREAVLLRDALNAEIGVG